MTGLGTFRGSSCANWGVTSVFRVAPGAACCQLFGPFFAIASAQSFRILHFMSHVAKFKSLGRLKVSVDPLPAAESGALQLHRLSTSHHRHTETPTSDLCGGLGESVRLPPRRRSQSRSVDRTLHPPRPTIEPTPIAGASLQSTSTRLIPASRPARLE